MSELYNFDTPISREGTNSMKWDRRKEKYQDPDVIPMSMADTDFACTPEVSEAIIKRCSHPVFGYSFPPAAFFTSIMDWFQTRHHLTLQKEWIRPLGGAVTGVSYAIQTLTEPGDKVLIQTPIYDPFKAVTEGTGRQCVSSPLIFQDNTYTMDFEDLERQFQDGVRLMVLCNPHNPVGRVWTEQELRQLAELCIKYHVYLVSDELHCDFALFGTHYTSILSIPEIHPLAVCCIAPGKTFNLSGLAVAAVLTPNPELNQKIFANLRAAWLINFNMLGLEAATAAYTHGGPWMDEQLKYIEGNSLLVQKRLAEEAPHIVPVRHEGTFLMWLNFNAFGLSNEELENEVVHTCRLGMNGGWHYGPGGDGFMRMNIGCTRQLLNTAIDRLVQMEQAHFPAK